jgi:hypothetical protein
MSSEWGKGAANNQNGYGQAAGNATNGYGESQKVSYAGVTDIVGLIALSISYSANNYCDDSGNTPAPTVSNNTGSGTFASTAGLIINTNTGVINTDTSTAGSYVVTYTDTDAATATFSLAINDLDNAAFSYSASSFEPTDADPTPTITGLTGGTFSGTTGLVINSTTGEIDLSASTDASHTVTYNTSTSGSSVCPNTSTFGVTIAVAGIANNYSMNFDGINDYLQTNSIFSALDGLQKMTLSLWMKPISGAPLYEYVVTVPRNTTANEHVFSLQHYENNYLTFSIDGRTTKYALGDINAISYGQWNHVACVLDGTLSGADRMKIYINGADETTSTSIGTFTALQNASGGLIIGEEPQQAYNPYKGLLDELGIWDTALTSSQVAQIYNATSTGKTADLSTISGSNLKYFNRMGD